VSYETLVVQYKQDYGPNPPSDYPGDPDIPMLAVGDLILDYMIRGESGEFTVGEPDWLDPNSFKIDLRGKVVESLPFTYYGDATSILFVEHGVKARLSEGTSFRVRRGEGPPSITSVTITYSDGTTETRP
jgi:hypothetical protein